MEPEGLGTPQALGRLVRPHDARRAAYGAAHLQRRRLRHLPLARRRRAAARRARRLRRATPGPCALVPHARQLHGVELLPAHRRRRERGVSAPVRAAVRLADVRRTAALLTMRSMRPSSCSSPPAGPPCWPGVCGGGGRRIRPGWRRRPNHDHRNRDTRHERRARRDVPGPRRAGARPGVDPPDDGGSSAGRGPRRPPPRALGRPARLSLHYS